MQITSVTDSNDSRCACQGFLTVNWSGRRSRDALVEFRSSQVYIYVSPKHKSNAAMQGTRRVPQIQLQKAGRATLDGLNLRQSHVVLSGCATKPRMLELENVSLLKIGSCTLPIPFRL